MRCTASRHTSASWRSRSPATRSHSLFPAFLHATTLLRDPFAGNLASLLAPLLALLSAFSLALYFSLATYRPPPAESIQDGAPFRVPGFSESIALTMDEVSVTRFLFDDLESFYLSAPG